MKNLTPRFIVAALLIAAAAIFLHAHSRSEVFPPRLALQQFPRELGDWTSGTDIPVNEETLKVLGHGDFLHREYQDESGGPSLELLIAFYPSQRAGDTAHSPKNCLPGSGWSQIDSRPVTLSFPGHAPFPATRYVVGLGDLRQVVLYWYWAHNRGVASEYWAKYYLVADSLKMNRSDGSLVRVSTPLDPGETADSAEQRLLPFIADLGPLLDRYIPR